MTAKIKVMDCNEATDYIHELFKEINLKDSIVIKTEDMELLTKSPVIKSPSTVTATHIQEFKKNAEKILKRALQNEDLAVVDLKTNSEEQNNKKPSSQISVTDLNSLKNKLVELGIHMENLDIAVITADNIQHIETSSVQNIKKTTLKLK